MNHAFHGRDILNFMIPSASRLLYFFDSFSHTGAYSSFAQTSNSSF